MDDDDDIYDPADITPASQAVPAFGNPSNGEVKMADAEEGEEEGEEGEDGSDDLKRPPSTSIPPPTITDPRSKTSTPLPRSAATPTPKSSSAKPPSPALPPDSRPGSTYPPVHASTLELNANPIHPSTKKPIMSTDFDTDFPTPTTHPWRKPGTDITDYFNYGFDEFTWASYCLKQQNMNKESNEIRSQAEGMKAFVEGIPGSGMGGAGAGAMPGMPSEAEMQQMFAGMMSQGMNPATMDQQQFMSMMMGGAGGMGGGQDAAFTSATPGAPNMGFAGAGGGGGFGQGGALDEDEPWLTPSNETELEWPVPEDKVIVMAHLKSENTDWVGEFLPDWQHAIYSVDSPQYPYHIPLNKGREAMTYLTYLIDHYSHLPSIIAFLHAHHDGYPRAWHTEPHYDNIKSLQNLKLDYVRKQGYVNLRCNYVPGCPDEVQPFREPPEKPHEGNMTAAWKALFGDEVEVPRVLAAACCSQFAVTREQVQKRSKKEYVSCPELYQCYADVYTSMA
ncbi:MAG: hypothetical protein Q9227_006162 [Pyrenula ochraceoflavens]